MRRSPNSLRASSLVTAAAALSSIGSIAATTGAAGASTPPAPPPTTVAVTYTDGVATAPDGSFSAAFAAAPTYTPSTDGLPERFYANAEEDAQEVARFGVDAFGASAETSAVERAERFVTASGTAVTWLANTPTRLGPDPAAHFIARLTLGDGRPAVVYGVVVADATRVTYAFATDIGGDDADRSREFVASFTSLLPAPSPVVATTTSSTTTTNSTTTTHSAGPATSAVAGSATTPVTSEAPTTAPTASAPTTAQATPPTQPPMPVGAVVAPDGTWWVTFPDDAEIVATASTDGGFAYTEYRAVVSGDTLAVRAVEIPAGYEWDHSTVPGYPGARVEGRSTTVGDSPAVASTFDQDGSTVTAVVVDTGSRLVAVTYLDDEDDDPTAADDFVASLGLAG